MTSEITAKLDTDGFIMINACLPELSGLDAFSELGSMVKLPGVSEVQVLTPRHVDQSTPNTYSGNFGVHDFPLHTDLAHWFLPPRYFALRCVVGSKRVSTSLIDMRDLLNVVTRRTLERGLVRPRRPLKRNLTLLRLLSQTSDSSELFRWDSLFVVPATTESQAICKDVSDGLASIEPKHMWLLNAGDTLIIDNWRILHGRSEVSTEDGTRQIERAYFGAIY